MLFAPFQVTRGQKMIMPAEKEYRMRAGREQGAEMVRLKSERSAVSAPGSLRSEFQLELNKAEEDAKKRSAQEHPGDEALALRLQEELNAANAAPSTSEAVEDLIALAKELQKRELEDDERLARQLAAEEGTVEEDLRLAQQLAEELAEQDRKEREEQERQDAAIAQRLEERENRKKAAAAAAMEPPVRGKSKRSTPLQVVDSAEPEAGKRAKKD